MDHETAVRLHATERYLLRQMPEDDQEAFEEHYFLCPACADDVRAGQEFIRHAKAYWKAESAVPAAPPLVEPKRPFWDGWFSRPAFSFSLAANLALGAVVIYMAAVQTRPAPSGPDSPQSQYLEEITVMKPSRGAQVKRELQTRQLVILGYDGADATSLTYQFLSPDGKVKLSGDAGKPTIDRTGAFHLAVAVGALEPGEYDVVVLAKKPTGDLRLGPTRVQIGR